MIGIFLVQFLRQHRNFTYKCFLLVLLWANLLHAQAAPVPVMVVRFSHVVAPNTPKGQMVEQLQKLVQQRSGGRIRLDIYPNSTLYGDDDEMEALESKLDKLERRREKRLEDKRRIKQVGAAIAAFFLFMFLMFLIMLAKACS